MDIKYMIQVQQNKKLRGFINEPMSIKEIEDLEKIYNQKKEFPKAFREFLFLAGNFNNVAFDLIEDFNFLQQMAKDDLEYTKMEVNRPFFAFDVLDSMYTVFFLDQKKEDPNVFIINPFLAKKKEEPLIKSANNFTFTSLVNESIRRVKNNIPF